jgi:hypothetical protein
MVVRVEERTSAAVEVQKLLTEFGCSIRMRLGLHDQGENNTCSPSGVLLLQLCCEAKDAKELEEKLGKIDGVKAQLVNFD